jgi:hypothetical protein
MSFSQLLAAYSDLRDGLRAQVDRSAIADLNIRPPTGDGDEASFLRLTAWCFSLLFEVGRYSIPFLLDLKFEQEHSRAARAHLGTRQIVQVLRSFVSHNLGFDEVHDVSLRKSASDWFVETCGATSPVTDAHWEKCFKRLCDDVRGCLDHCAATLSRVAAPNDDRELIINDLRRRLKRNWEPHQFDQIVESAAARLGEQINARVFRDHRIGAWRNFIASLPDDADPELELERLIDGQVADHFRSQLPLRAAEIMEALDLEPGPQVKKAIEIVKRLHDAGIREKDELLVRARAEFEGDAIEY